MNKNNINDYEISEPFNMCSVEGLDPSEYFLYEKVTYKDGKGYTEIFAYIYNICTTTVS